MAYSVKRLEAFSDWLYRGVVTTKTKIIKVFDLPEFDAAEYLDSADDIAACLTTVLEENDAALLAAALGYSRMPSSYATR